MCEKRLTCLEEPTLMKICHTSITHLYNKITVKKNEETILGAYFPKIIILSGFYFIFSI